MSLRKSSAELEFFGIYLARNVRDASGLNLLELSEVARFNQIYFIARFTLTKFHSSFISPCRGVRVVEYLKKTRQ